MNENANVLTGVMLAIAQLQNLKGKVDDEVIDHLAKSGQDAIKSAHHFLDACEKTLEILTASQSPSTSEKKDEDLNENSNVVDLKAHEV